MKMREARDAIQELLEKVLAEVASERDELAHQLKERNEAEDLVEVVAAYLRSNPAANPELLLLADTWLRVTGRPAW